MYRDARYEDVQAWTAQLRGEYGEMNPAERTEYHYLSGMTAYRLTQHDDALHELALAAQAARRKPDALNAEQRSLLFRTLEELLTTRTRAVQ
jgi:phage tail tube protein FII